MYTLIVGTQDWSSWSLRPYLALMATGAPFEMEVIGLRVVPTSRETILKHSPAGKVPVLKFTEGGKAQTVWDSLAICETLAERHPERGLWPADADLRARARSYAAEMHSGFPDLRNQLTMDFARTLPLPELTPETRSQIDRIIAAWDEALTASGNGFLFGDFSIADCMYAPVVSRFTTYGVEVPERVKHYMDKIWALPGMQNWLKASQKEVAAGLTTCPSP
ncbi:MAG TPA: glutathione S-transferase [Rhizomicrobium sp.]|nr:glutathione S-transferase [Rhizomicrobium sp.]